MNCKVLVLAKLVSLPESSLLSAILLLALFSVNTFAADAIVVNFWMFPLLLLLVVWLLLFPLFLLLLQLS